MTGSESAIFDYSVAAELYSARNGKRKRSQVGYRRFPNAADAILFAIETLSREQLFGTFLEVDGERYGAEDLRRLYDSVDFPLPRGAANPAQ